MVTERLREVVSTGVALGIAVLMCSCSDDDSGKVTDSGTSSVVVAGSQLTQVSTEGGHPTVSPDGLWIAYRLSGAGIVRMEIGGTQKDTLVGSGLDPDWSAYNNLIVYRDSSVLYTLDPVNRTVTSLYDGEFDDDPCWSPNGDEIAVQCGSGIRIVGYPSGTSSVISCSATGSTCDGEIPTWSGDGTWLAFEDGMEIMKVPRSGGTATAIVEDVYDVSYPAWSPDGKWVAYTMSDSTSNYNHVWIADERGMASGNWQITSGAFFDSDLTWSPDSKWLYFDRSAVTGPYSWDDMGIWRISIDVSTTTVKQLPR